MNTQKFLVSGIVGGIVSFFAGYLIYGLALADFFSKNTGSATGVMRATEDMIWWSMILGSLFYGLFISYIFNKWANITSMGSGLSAGFVIGLLISAAYDLSIYANANIFTLKAVGVDIVASAVLLALVGGAVGLMNGMGKKAAA